MYRRAAAAAALLVAAGACSSSSSSTSPTTTTTAASPTTSTTQPTAKAAVRWQLAPDFLHRPGVNPFPRTTGGPPVWSLLASDTLERTGTYRRLRVYSPSYASGVVAWHGATNACGGLPAIGVAVAGPAKVCTATIPHAAAFVSPDRHHLAVVGWRSPITGDVAIATGLADLDSSCGDGVPYWIHRGTTSLAQGVLVRGGSKVLPALKTPVRRGESVYFIVGPGPSGRDGCDATQLQVTIVPT